MTETEPIVRVSGVSHAFGDREVLHGVDVDVSPGELLGVVGPNGAGKTTLIRLMQGLLRPAVGSVTTFGAAAWPPTASATDGSACSPRTRRSSSN